MNSGSVDITLNKYLPRDTLWKLVVGPPTVYRYHFSYFGKKLKRQQSFKIHVCITHVLSSHET